MSKGITRQGFDVDLIIGQEAESLLADLLGVSSMEVKRDTRAHETGNVFVEYEYRGRRSGVMTSKADWWVQVLDQPGSAPVIVIMSTKRMRALVKLARAKGYGSKGGDYDRSKGALIPVEWLTRSRGRSGRSGPDRRTPAIRSVAHIDV